MKYKIILFLLITSCINYSSSNKLVQTYSGKGFAFIVDSEDFFVSQNNLKNGTKIMISNPHNKKQIKLVIKEKIKYNNFYKVLISSSVAQKLNLGIDFPYVEINEIKNNKSFVAEKSITQDVEKMIANKAPVEKVSISNISKVKKNKDFKDKKKNRFVIVVAEFYSFESANSLKNKLETNLKSYNLNSIFIKKRNSTNFQLFLGPYKAINVLKNDYIALNESGFEDLDIIIYE